MCGCELGLSYLECIITDEQRYCLECFAVGDSEGTHGVALTESSVCGTCIADIVDGLYIPTTDAGKAYQEAYCD